MIFIFDTNSLSNILNHYYASHFPSFWARFDLMIKSKNIISVREVYNELTNRFEEDKIERIMNENSEFFANPTIDELNFITQIYAIQHFQQNLDKKRILSGGFFADPFVIAKAWKLNAGVVTEEENKPNAARIPNICDHFNIPCLKFEGFLNENDWTF